MILIFGNSTQVGIRRIFQGSSEVGILGEDMEDVAPGKCHFFTWLVTFNRCWTVDMLARHMVFIIPLIASIATRMQRQ